MRTVKPMDAAKSLPPTSEISADKVLPGGRHSSGMEASEDIIAAGAVSIAEMEKLMEELRMARDYLQSEAERVRRINARYAHLTRTASASVKIIAESMGKWRTTELEATRETDAGSLAATRHS